MKCVNIDKMSRETCKILNALLEHNTDLAKTLISAGEPVNVQNAFGLCALHLAVEKNQIELVQLLLRHGANPNLRNEYRDLPIKRVEKENDLPIFLTSITPEVIEELQELGQRTALHIATKNGFSDIASLLLANGALVDIQDVGGCTPLHWAAMRGDVPLIKLLLDNGAAPNKQDLASSAPLHEAVRHRNLEASRHLLERSANPQLLDMFGTSPLDLAISFPALYNLLLRYSETAPANIIRH
jgi:ankyrin repeat protein